MAEFAAFAKTTGYRTDAERYGWSIVQRDVFAFDTAEGATWRTPDGATPVRDSTLPVTQVSYNDAVAYCAWAGARLPTYGEYWRLVADDDRRVVTDYLLPIAPVAEVNVVGNVWELTATTRGPEVRLAGGSVFCSPTTCNGTLPERALWVDRETGNVHIGFAVVRE